MPTFLLYYLCVLLFLPTISSLIFKVPESVPIGHVVGYVEGAPKMATDSKFFVVYPDENTEKCIRVDERTGEIRTITLMDYEKTRKFEILTIPIEGGDGIQTTIEVEDENDNTPTFPDEKITMEISEYARVGAEYALPTAIDHDGDELTVQKYRIAQGNVNNVFKITTRRLNEILHADLVVNGQLDREYRDKYELLIEAIDGGKPEKIGRLRVSITILDANDNAPVFSQPRYSVSIPANSTVGSTILTLKATDGDVNDNGKIGFRFQKKNSGSSSLFTLSPTGILTTAGHFLPGSVHDLIVVAFDHGIPPLETTAFVTVAVQGSSLSAPALDIIWLTDSGTAHLMENVTLGSIVARISLNEQQRDGAVFLSGCPSLCIRQSDSSHIYLMLICGLFDRESMAEYHMKFSLKKEGELVLEHPVLLTIGDVNDNAPRWSNSLLHINLNRTGGVQDPTMSLAAIDPDQGANGRIRYSVLDTDLISIDSETGRLISTKELDCSIGPTLRFRVHAQDGGSPPLSSELQVTADLLDSASRPPQFEKSLYEVSMKEDSDTGICVLKVRANNSECGGSARFRYAIQENSAGRKIFNVDSTSGTVCLESKLDFEDSDNYQLTLTVTDHSGQTGTSLLSVTVLDVNDNLPIFYPMDYNVTIREGDNPTGSLLIVSATDADTGPFGQVRYSLLAGDTHIFNVDSVTGEVSSRRQLQRGIHELTIQATDSGGMRSEQAARVFITVLSSDAAAPSFTQSKYSIRTSEDILPGISIGAVYATGPGRIRYSIYSGDPDHQFTIHPETGRITVSRYLDADKHDTVLLNIQADLINGGSNHTQVLISIDDHNDNSPKFATEMVEIVVKEDQPLHESFYVVHATDKDKKKNGAVTYSILSSHPPCPVMIQPLTGQLQLTAALDYESIKNYRIRVKAQDQGVPPRSSNMTLILHVSDVNDNPPQMEKTFYEASVVENCPLMTEVIQLKATDADSDLNGRVSYRITNGSDAFGIDEKTGTMFVNKEIDREQQGYYNITVTAEDQGKPPLSTSVEVRVTVLDINDNAPSCVSISALVFSLDAPAQSSIGSILISDADKGENGSVVYRSQQNHPLFIVKGNGEVLLRRILTEKDGHDFRLSVIASDQGQPKKSTVCHIPIKVTRGMSQVTLIEPIERTIRVPLKCERSCQLTVVNATGVSKWQLQNSEVSSHFSFRGGVLSMVSPPMLPSPWTLNLILFDREGRQKQLTMKVIASSSKNSKEPIRLLSTLPIGTKIASIGAHSTNGQWFFKLENETSLLELDEISGNIYLTRRLRDLTDQSFTLLFHKINTSTTDSEPIEMSFQVAAGGGERPVFAPQPRRIVVKEDTFVGSLIVNANATVSDVTASVSYLLKDPSDRFAIDQFSGDITLTNELDWYEAPRHTLVVEATSNGAKSTRIFEIIVEDVNNNHPDIISESIVFIFTDSPRIIHYVVATDRDADKNAEISYEVISNDAEFFKIDAKSGALSMVKLPETDKSITVRAIDGGTPPLFTDQRLDIRILNATRPWKYFVKTEVEVELREGAEMGSLVVEFDSKLPASLQLVPEDALFRILPGNAIKTRGELPVGKYQLCVLARSPEGHVDWTDVSVTVKPVALAPRISSSSCGAVTVTENRAIDGIKQIVVTEASKNLKFRIQGSNNLFEINEKTGSISCAALDRETRAEHLLVVKAEDNGKVDSCTVRITVSDVNDNSPIFAPSTPQLILINDTTQIGDVLFRFSASDADIGDNGKVLLDLIEDPSKMLTLQAETGELILTRNLPLHQKEWMIRVKASDNGYPALSVDRFIRVKDSRDSIQKYDTEPAFLKQKYITTVDEGLERGQPIAKVATFSRDSRITYSIVEGNVDRAFDVDSEGLVRTSQELDYEIRSNYDLKLIATGAFKGQVETQVSVKVNNINDNPPSFPAPRKRKVPESLPKGSYLSTVTANDADIGTLLEYSLLPTEHRVTIDKFTGVIHTIMDLDYEVEKELKIGVMTTDGNYTASTVLLVEVLDVNDNAPEFPKRFYDIKIPATTKPEDVVIRFLAVDVDSGANGAVTYSLKGSEDLFEISPSDGTLTVSAPLNDGSEYIFSIWATDHGVPALASAAAVRISVTKEEQKEAPTFDRQNYEFLIRESLPPRSVIGNLSIGSGPLWYRILDIEASKVFDIDRLGRISTKGKLDRETRDRYSFQVDVGSDFSSFHQNSTAVVRITVSDDNDNAPVFASEDMHLTIKDGLSTGDVIQRLSASDEDSGEGSHVSYRILSGNDYGIFSLDSETGALTFNEWNDDQLVERKNGSWVMTVEARDNGHPKRSSILNIEMSVDLSTWSGSAPFFVVQNYIVHVEELAARGSMVFKARAVNRFSTPMKNINYQLRDNDEAFTIDPSSGIISLRRELDYESRSSYRMSLSASDGKGRSAVVPMEVRVLPVDEFAPVFTQTGYTFQIPLSTSVDSVIGSIHAVDADGGDHGRVRYHIESDYQLVGIDEDSGKISLKHPVDHRKNLTIEQFVVIAQSSHIQQSKATVYLEIGAFPTRGGDSLLSSNVVKVVAGTTVVLFVILLIVLICCVLGYRTKTKIIESPKKQVYSVSRGQIAVMSNVNRNLPSYHPSRGAAPVLPSNINQQANSMTSSISTNSNIGMRHSALSKDFISTRSQPDSGIDPDNLSINSSVTDYLVSIGVNPNPIPPKPKHRRAEPSDSLMNEYIYARVEDIVPPGPLNLTGHINTFEHRSTAMPNRVDPPTFQPLTEIFSEIAEMQREERARSRENPDSQRHDRSRTSHSTERHRHDRSRTREGPDSQTPVRRREYVQVEI